MITLFKRRTIYVPTVFGSVLLGVLFLTPVVYWVRYGEVFLALTERVPAKILVVEGWIGPEGLRAAKAEFERGDYGLLVTSGGRVDLDHFQEGWTYAEGAYHSLVRLGLPAEKIVAAPSEGIGRGRTYESALAVKAVLGNYERTPQSLNVFSFGSHARRSQLVYAKAFPGTAVGIIAWEPERYAKEFWWRSSERSIEMLVQSVGFFYEFLFNSGRV